MTTKKTLPTFKAQSSQTELPVYRHSDTSEFIRIDDFDLFETMLWHQGVARDSGNAKAESLRRSGVQSLLNTPHADAAANCRAHFERLQSAFDALLALKEQEKLARQNRGQAKGRLIPGWQELVSNAGTGSNKKIDPALFDTTKSSLERLHSYKVAATSGDVIKMMMIPARNRLQQAQKDLSDRLYLIGKTTVKELAMNNILCARQLLLSKEPSADANDELRENSILSCATQFLICDQWDLEAFGEKGAAAAATQSEPRPHGWGNMPSPVDY